MSREERQEIANRVLQELRALSYDGCRALMKDVSARIVHDKAKEFQVEVEAFWDDRKHQNIRVLVAVSDGGLSDFHPTTAAFIISPDGSYIGEDSPPNTSRT